MSIKILGTVDKLVTKDGRIVQQAGDTDGVVASFYDLSGRPSLFLDGTQARLGNVGVKTATPNEALTVVGNVSSTGSLSVSALYSSTGADILIGSNLVPTTSAFYIGDPGNPVAGIYLAATTLYIASTFAGVSGLKLSNIDNVFTVADGGLRSSIIYTGGLLLSGNNIAADPLYSNRPMTVGGGLTEVQIKVNTTIAGTLSSSGLISQQKNHCVAALTTNQAMSGGDVAIRFTDKDDPNGWWDSANYQFKPTVAGYYNVIVMVNWRGTNAEVQVNNQLRKNGNTIALSQMPIPKTLTHSLLIQAITFMNGSSDYLDCSGYAGSNTDITGEANGVWTKFEAFKIS